MMISKGIRGRRWVGGGRKGHRKGDTMWTEEKQVFSPGYQALNFYFAFQSCQHCHDVLGFWSLFNWASLCPLLCPLSWLWSRSPPLASVSNPQNQPEQSDRSEEGELAGLIGYSWYYSSLSRFLPVSKDCPFPCLSSSIQSNVTLYKYLSVTLPVLNHQNPATAPSQNSQCLLQLV